MYNLSLQHLKVTMQNYSPEKVTVGMVTFNRWEYTKKTLEYYFRNTDPQVQLIIVDNASQDETLPKLKKLVENSKKLDFNIHLLENSVNIGVGAAINQAFSYSSREMLVKLDNDLIVSEDWLSALWTIFNHFGNKFGTCCLQIADINKELDVPHSFSKGRIETIGDILFEHTAIVNGATMTLRRSFWNKFPFLETRYYGHEDALMANKTAELGLVCGQLRSPNTFAIHLQGDHLYWGYDSWKADITFVQGRKKGALDYKKDVYCIPKKGKEINEIKRKKP